MNNEEGFSLLEILVAFAILALALGILLRIFSGGVNTAVVADGYITAVQIAESLLAKTGVEAPLQIGQSSGVENDIYYWQITVNPYYIADITQDSGANIFNLMQIDVSVSWQEGVAEPRSVELTTLRLVNNVL